MVREDALRGPWGSPARAARAAGAGGYYVAEYYNYVVRRVFANGTVTTVAGRNANGRGYSGDGLPASGAAGASELLVLVCSCPSA